MQHNPLQLCILTGMFLMMTLGACSHSGSEDGKLMLLDETSILIDYLEKNGNLINSPDIPHAISADQVYSMLHSGKQLIIDLRPAQEWSAGHIQHAVNVLPGDILDYYEQVIDPNAFHRIVLVCPDAMLSGYVSAVLQYMGYHNTMFLRNGLSSWDMEIAREYWLAHTSSHLAGTLETKSNPKNAPGPLPGLHTGGSAPYSILRARAEEILQVHHASITIPVDQVIEKASDYYIVNYWAEALYNQGHLTGAVQYDQRASFGKNQYLNTLPANRPIVLYCNTAHHSTYVVAYLRLLGYDAYHIPYGVNAFNEQFMIENQPGMTFSPAMVKDFPLVGKDPDETGTETEIKTETISVQGGC